jgi:mono/diheme cytochrome c family protein
MKKLSLAALSIPLALWALPGVAGDAAAGKTLAEAQCGECHYAEDWEGESAEDIAALIKAVADGSAKHKGKVELSDAEIANVAAYWATGGK